MITNSGAAPAAVWAPEGATTVACPAFICYRLAMNEHIRQPIPATSQAAEGLPRRSWTMAEIEAMVAAGIIAENERFELIGGEIVPMSPKGAFHETVKKELNRSWIKHIPDHVDMATETTFRLGERDFLEPDFVFWPRALGIRGLKPEVVQLVVEIADSSLAWDMGRKATIYAGLGLPEYWVIEARTLVTHIHRAPIEGRFTSLATLAAGEWLEPLALPMLKVRLADLGLKVAGAEEAD
jgi:Uma2 family endonuclease